MAELVADTKKLKETEKSQLSIHCAVRPIWRSFWICVEFPIFHNLEFKSLKQKMPPRKKFRFNFFLVLGVADRGGQSIF